MNIEWKKAGYVSVTTFFAGCLILSVFGVIIETHFTLLFSSLPTQEAMKEVEHTYITAERILTKAEKVCTAMSQELTTRSLAMVRPDKRELMDDCYDTRNRAVAHAKQLDRCIDKRALPTLSEDKKLSEDRKRFLFRFFLKPVIFSIGSRIQQLDRNLEKFEAGPQPRA